MQWDSTCGSQDEGLGHIFHNDIGYILRTSIETTVCVSLYNPVIVSIVPYMRQYSRSTSTLDGWHTIALERPTPSCHLKSNKLLPPPWTLRNRYMCYIKEVDKDWPPPFPLPGPCSVASNLLIHLINVTHTLIVEAEHIVGCETDMTFLWPCDHLWTCPSTKIWCIGNNTVVMPAYHQHIRTLHQYMILLVLSSWLL